MGPVWNVSDANRGVVCEGPVGFRWLGRFRAFRYEVRCWPGAPSRMSLKPSTARCDYRGTSSGRSPARGAPRGARADLGRDELGTGEMWNSNSVVAWALARSGEDMDTIEPPPEAVRRDGGQAWCSLDARPLPASCRSQQADRRTLSEPCAYRGSGAFRCRWSVLGWSHAHHLPAPLRPARRRVGPGRDRGPDLPDHHREAGRPDRLVPLIGRAQAQQLRVLAAADDIAIETGDRSTAHWLATQTRDNPGTLRRHAALADALDRRWTGVADAFATGDLNLAQVRVIADALDALPSDLGDDLRAKAETLIVTEAATLGPRELRVYGTRLLEYLAPDIAKEADYRRLLAEERRAAAATRLSIRRRGDGSADLHARIPDHAASRSSAYLDAYTAPRRHHLHRDEHRRDAVRAAHPCRPRRRRPAPAGPATRRRVRRAAREHPHHQPAPPRRHRHRGDGGPRLPDTLLSGTGTATTSTGETITAGQARRLACQAGIIPVVLGADSEILDVGRTNGWSPTPSARP